jgi:hypothetical protein
MYELEIARCKTLLAVEGISFSLKNNRCLVSFYLLVLTVSISKQTATITIPNITPPLFKQLHRKYGSTLSCPCSEFAVPYSSFVEYTVQFHPVCTSLFVTPEWIEALYLLNASKFMPMDFRATAHAQVRSYQKTA